MLLKNNSYLRSLGGQAMLVACAANAFLANTPLLAQTPTLNAAPVNNIGALSNIQHIVVIYQENWPFDGLYGSFPGANGIANASATSLNQLDKLTGASLSSEIGTGTYNDQSNTIVVNNPPGPLNTAASALDPTFQSNGQTVINTLSPYSLTSVTGVNPSYITGDIYHRYWSEEEQINGGAMNLFVSWSDDPGLVMSHFDATNLPEGLLAQQYTIGDNFFHSAFGGSFLNHQFLIAAQAPVYPTAPASILSVVDPVTGHLKLYGKDSAQTINITGVSGTAVTVASTVGMYKGQTISGTGVTGLDGGVVSAVTSPTTFTLTASVSGSYSGTATANPATSTATTSSYSYGKLINDSKVTPIGAPSIVTPSVKYDKQYAVNTIYSINLTPVGTAAALGSSVIPSCNDSNPSNPNYYLNIGDLLSQANVSWKWYSGDWDLMVATSPSGNPNTTTTAYSQAVAQENKDSVQWHHQCFAYFDNYAPFDNTNTVPPSLVGGFAGYQPTPLTAGQSGVTRAQNSAAHIQDETHFFQDVSNGTLPAVSFIKNYGSNNEHPGYAALQVGQNYVASIVQAIQANPALWATTAIIITYDEHGGRWDHVTPPSRDIWGPGERVPLIVISPYAQQGYVDHNQYDTTSILSTIEARFLSASAGVPQGQYTSYLNSLDQNAPTFAEIFTSVGISRSGFALNRRTGNFTQTVTLSNLGSTPTSAPVYLHLNNLSSNATLVSPANTGTTGNPSVLASSSPIAAGASVTVTLQFSVPTSGGITYTASTSSNP